LESVSEERRIMGDVPLRRQAIPGGPIPVLFVVVVVVVVVVIPYVRWPGNQTSQAHWAMPRRHDQPFAEGHVSLNLSLLTSEAVILDAEKEIERERRLGKFVRMAELVLCRRKAEICGTFQVSSGFLNSSGTRWYEGSKGLRGNGGKFAEKEKAIYVGRLRHL
jgi:hypothetical protein